MSAFVMPPGLSAQAQFGSRASQLDYRGVSPSSSQKSMSNGERFDHWVFQKQCVRNALKEL